MSGRRFVVDKPFPKKREGFIGHELEEEPAMAAFNSFAQFHSGAFLSDLGGRHPPTHQLLEKGSSGDPISGFDFEATKKNIADL